MRILKIKPKLYIFLLLLVLGLILVFLTSLIKFSIVREEYWYPPIDITSKNELIGIYQSAPEWAWNPFSKAKHVIKVATIEQKTVRFYAYKVTNSLPMDYNTIIQANVKGENLNNIELVEMSKLGAIDFNNLKSNAYDFLNKRKILLSLIGTLIPATGEIESDLLTLPENKDAFSFFDMFYEPSHSVILLRYHSIVKSKNPSSVVVFWVSVNPKNNEVEKLYIGKMRFIGPF
jgi:hypothetical protein